MSTTRMIFHLFIQQSVRPFTNMLVMLGVVTHAYGDNSASYPTMFRVWSLNMSHTYFSINRCPYPGLASLFKDSVSEIIGWLTEVDTKKLDHLIKQFLLRLVRTERVAPLNICSGSFFHFGLLHFSWILLWNLTILYGRTCMHINALVDCQHASWYFSYSHLIHSHLSSLGGQLDMYAKFTEKCPYLFRPKPTKMYDIPTKKWQETGKSKLSPNFRQAPASHQTNNNVLQPPASSQRDMVVVRSAR